MTAQTKAWVGLVLLAAAVGTFLPPAGTWAVTVLGMGSLIWGLTSDIDPPA